MMHLEELVQRAWVIKSAGVVGGWICLFSILCGHFGAAFTYPFFSSLFSTIICFGSCGTYLSRLLFLFHDISWTLMTQTTVTNPSIKRHTHTHLHSLLTVHVLYLGYPPIRNIHT